MRSTPGATRNSRPGNVSESESESGIEAEGQGQEGGEAVHLIVLIHGLYGTPSNLAVVKEELERASSLAQASTEQTNSKTSSSSSNRKRKDKRKEDDGDGDDEGDGEEDEVDELLRPESRFDGKRIMPSRVLVLKSFEGSHTWDGIDINAQRAAKEVRPRHLHHRPGQATASNRC